MCDANQPGRPNPLVTVWSAELPIDQPVPAGVPISKGLIPVPDEFRQKLVFHGSKWCTVHAIPGIGNL